jgi:hypothetical protein
MSDGDADAKTSAGAPATIWVARAPDDPKFIATDVPGCRCSKLVASWVNVWESEDAADTVMAPVSRGIVEVELVVEVVLPDVELEQALAAAASTARAVRAHLRPGPDRLTGSLP